MILALDTSTATCRLWLVSPQSRDEYEWEAGRGLADGLIRFLREKLSEHDVNWSDITGIAAYRGPGSFTGLRIGLTVLNTIADDRHIPIVGASEDGWLDAALSRLEAGETDGLVMPLYGRAPNITKPRK